MPNTTLSLGASRSEPGLSSLLRRELQAAKLLPVAEKILAQEKLELRDAEQLSRYATLPVLAGLIALDAQLRNRAPQAPCVRALFYLPLASVLEREGMRGGASFLLTRITELDAELALESQPIFIAVDRWTGQFGFSEFAELLSQLRTINTRHRLEILGPSTVDLAQMLDSGEGEGEHDRSFLEQILVALRDLGIGCIEGGSDIDLHREAALLGFDSIFAHELSLDSPGTELFTPSVENTLYRPTEFTREFLQEFALIRSEIEPLGHLSTWFPWTAALLDHRSGKAAPIAVQVLRAIALGRLMFPSIAFIRAPLSALGLKVAHVAVEFGANDLGFAAVDSATERSLGVARLSDTLPILRDHHRISPVII